MTIHFLQNVSLNKKYRGWMKPHSKEARKFLDLCWEQQIYKNTDIKHVELALMLGFEKYPPSINMCKNHFGLTIEFFFIHCKVAEIKDFLADPESRKYEMNEIAQKLGYTYRSKFNRLFKSVTDITQREFWYFHEHFVKTTGVSLVEYEAPDTGIYMPQDGKPSFLSNFLNKKAAKLNYYNNNGSL